MKIQSIIAAGFITILSMSFITASARQGNDFPIKVLPTTEKGIFKILFAADATEGVQIKFYNENELLFSDKIKGEDLQKGFSKRYDARKVKPGIWVDIKSGTMVTTYRINATRDWQTFEPILEKTTISHDLVASKN